MHQIEVRGRFVLSAMAVFVWLLGSCGGSASSPTDPGTPRVDETEVEYFSFQLVNQARGEEGAGELMYDETLANVARAYSRRMRDEGFFAHVDPAGMGFSDRLHAAGVHVLVAGENLAVVEGSDNPASSAHRGFLNNSAHRDNLLDGRFTHAGIGVARRGDTYWLTQLFIRR